MQVDILRLEDTGKETFGVLLIDGALECLTLERPYLDNRKNISCIPTGNYLCGRVDSPKFKNTFEVRDVPERSHILFHTGNTYDESLGCIILGSMAGILGYDRALLQSRRAFNGFMDKLSEVDEFHLGIMNAPGNTK